MFSISGIRSIYYYFILSYSHIVIEVPELDLPPTVEANNNNITATTMASATVITNDIATANVPVTAIVIVNATACVDISRLSNHAILFCSFIVIFH